MGAFRNNEDLVFENVTAPYVWKPLLIKSTSSCLCSCSNYSLSSGKTENRIFFTKEKIRKLTRCVAISLIPLKRNYLIMRHQCQFSVFKKINNETLILNEWKSTRHHNIHKQLHAFYVKYFMQMNKREKQCCWNTHIFCHL